MKQLTETERFIRGKITDRIHRLSLKFSREILEEGCSLLLPCQMQKRFYEKWEEYAQNN